MKTHMRPESPAAAEVDARDARDLASAENAELCAGCVKCCTYITIEIDAPRAAWEYDQWIWALHHRRVQLYVERPERWFLHFETVCGKLGDGGRCTIHGRHPALCRDHDARSCERRLPLADMRAWFDDAEQFEAWIQRERPGHWRALLAHRGDTSSVTAFATRPRPAIVRRGGPAPPSRNAPASGASFIPVAALAGTRSPGVAAAPEPALLARRRSRPGRVRA